MHGDDQHWFDNAVLFSPRTRLFVFLKKKKKKELLINLISFFISKIKYIYLSCGAVLNNKSFAKTKPGRRTLLWLSRLGSLQIVEVSVENTIAQTKHSTLARDRTRRGLLQYGIVLGSRFGRCRARLITSAIVILERELTEWLFRLLSLEFLLHGVESSLNKIDSAFRRCR